MQENFYKYHGSHSDTESPESFYGGGMQKYPSDLYHTNHLVASVNQKLNVLIILKIICLIMGGVGLVFFYKYFMLKSGKK